MDEIFQDRPVELVLQNVVHENTPISLFEVMLMVPTLIRATKLFIDKQAIPLHGADPRDPGERNSEEW